MPDDTQIDLRQTVAELRQQLDARTAERDEALAREAAMAEVMQVINSSPSDLAPVFDAMLARAVSLCEATHGHIWRVEGHQAHAVALRGDAQFIESMRRESPTNLLSGRPLTRIARGEHVVRIPDATKEELYRTHHAYREFIDASGIRSGVMVALRKDEALLGVFVVYRQEVRPFTDKQIALLQNFAAQAVIAMENARLLTETREALEQQTATAEVLGVINSSPGDLAPVFDAMLDRAMRLCDANFGWMFTIDGDSAHIVAERDVPKAFVAYVTKNPPGIGPDTFFGRAILRRSIIHTADITTADTYRSGHPLANAAADLGGVRAILMAPLLKEDRALGVFAIFRTEVRPFTNKQIALLENFAAQAVIAMENARLITETREALEQQTATAELLGVINSSPGDLEPVFESILDKAHALCGADRGGLILRDGERFHAVALYGMPQQFENLLREPFGPTINHKRLLQGERLIHIPDIAAHEPTTPIGRSVVEA